MENNSDKELVKFILSHMMTSDQIKEMLIKMGVRRIPAGNKEKRVSFAAEHPEVTLDSVRDHLTGIWRDRNPAPAAQVANLVEHLKSKKLAGHDWHGARPSTMHLSLQNMVRDCLAGKIPLDRLIEIGADIMKHEYFMTATHDALETSIIDRVSGVIPPVCAKSITDFIYRDVPVDLKVTTYPSGDWTDAGSLSNERKRALATELYGGADSDRQRKQAEDTPGNLGLNRMYVVVRDQNVWFDRPKETIDGVVGQLKHGVEPFRVNVGGAGLSCFCIEA